MIVRYLLAAILAGCLAGVFATGAQAVKVWPLIIEAEKYENSGEASHTHGEVPLEDADAAAHKGDDGEAHSHDAEAWGPEDGLERTFYSLVSNVITGVAYSLIMTAIILFTGQSVTLQSGIVWGAGGFVAFMLAPSLGLPPEVPGTVVAGVQERQIWWTVTVAMSVAGLLIFAFRQQWYWIVLGIALMVAPHLYGAPVPEHHASLAPAWITAEFIVATIVTACLFWLFLGGVLGWLLSRFTMDEA